MGVPVPSGVAKQREVLEHVKIIGSELEEGAKAGSYKNRMSGIESNVIARRVSDGFHEPLCSQKFLDGKMRKLNNS